MVQSYCITIYLLASNTVWPIYEEHNVHFQCIRILQKTSSLIIPVLGLLRPVMNITKQSSSIILEVFLNFSFLLYNILKSFLESCQSTSCKCALSTNFRNCSTNSVTWEICSCHHSIFLLWPKRVYPTLLLTKCTSADINFLSSVLRIVNNLVP
jgi:hypothetical protein